MKLAFSFVGFALSPTKLPTNHIDTSLHQSTPPSESDEGNSMWIHEGSIHLPPLIETNAPTINNNTIIRRIIKPPNPDYLFQWYADIDQMDSDPSWANIWPIAMVLAQHIADSCCGMNDVNYDGKPSSLSKNFVSGSHIIELGCGLGWVGLIAAKSGGTSAPPPKSVVFVDQDPYALYCAMSSAELNGLTIGDVPLSKEMDPTKEEEEEVSNTVISAVMLNWSNDFPDSLIDFANVVIAADVLYDESFAVSLASAIKSVLVSGKEGGLALIADPMEGRAPKCRDVFVQSCEGLGGKVRLINAGGVGEGDDADVMIIEVKFP